MNTYDFQDFGWYKGLFFVHRSWQVNLYALQFQKKKDERAFRVFDNDLVIGFEIISKYSFYEY